ncbi:putative carbonic anhydrase 3 [Bradysia coprophila]|uniref:putative carbonic anhydrase 3 n=1 Tax=Bradysia coprophila TaxID=38358 RepID=UPI00187D9AA9|nr:putative carbonic anhydrase 3 [Bradysia coprophila]
MQHSNIIKLLILLLNCVCVLSVGMYSTNSAKFCYEKASCGPNSNAWGGECKTGTKQSPIDLPYVSSRSMRRVKLEFTKYYYSDEFWIIDNGHTIKVTLTQQQRPKARMYGYEFCSEYILAEIHFHWGYNASTGSEHSINNKFYAMEAHLVHFDSKYSNLTVAAASRDPSALAVLGVFIAEGSESNYNSGFETIADNIPQSIGKAAHIQQKINLSSFLPKKKQPFYRYYGSLTTPECNEIVVWTVVAKPIYVQPSLIQKFRDVKHIGSNYRPIQKLGQRTVKYLAKQ